jgi:hypothetical protein
MQQPSLPPLALLPITYDALTHTHIHTLTYTTHTSTRGGASARTHNYAALRNMQKQNNESVDTLSEYLVH